MDAKKEPPDLDVSSGGGGGSVEAKREKLVVDYEGSLGGDKTAEAMQPLPVSSVRPRLDSTKESQELTKEELSDMVKTEAASSEAVKAREDSVEQIKKESSFTYVMSDGLHANCGGQRISKDQSLKIESWFDTIKDERRPAEGLKRESTGLKRESCEEILDVAGGSSDDDVQMIGNPVGLCKEPPRKVLKLLNVVDIFGQILVDMPDAVEAFWLRRSARMRARKRLAAECAKVGPLIRQRAAELRAAAARRRLEMLRSGDLDGYRSAVDKIKESRLQEILEETERIFRDMKLPKVGHGSLAVDILEQPRSMNQKMKLLDYQLHGLRWLAELFDCGMSGILADDMGLGKTVQAIALLVWLMENKDEQGPHLIVVPMSVLPHWADEIRHWAPTLRFSVLRGGGWSLRENVKAMIEGSDSVNITLTTFETVNFHAALMGQIPWHTVIIDEGHRMKNYKTNFSRAVRAMACQHKLLLTGTPLQNSLRELWSLLAFVAPREFGSLADFEQWFALPKLPSVDLGDANPDLPLMKDAMGGDASKTAAKKSAARATTVAAPGDTASLEAETQALLSEEEELLIIQRLHSVLRPFILRRTKDKVLASLPEKKEVVLWVPLSPWQQALYHGGLRRIAATSDGGPTRLGRATTCSLRKALNHPFHFILDKKGRPTSPAGAAMLAKAENLHRASGKFELLERVLPRLLRFGHKILIFAQMTGLLDLLEQLLRGLGILFARLDGKKKLKARRKAVDYFRDRDDVSVMLLTTRAGGIGLNLQVADTVILFDSDWNPQADLQAMDRTHRIGQTRPVRVIRLMTPTSLDRGILNRGGRKIDMERKVISAGRFSHTGGSASKNGCNTQQQDEGILLRALVREARICNSEAAAFAKRSTGCTSLQEVSRLLARTVDEQLAFDEADTDLLGEAAATEGGRLENLTERLQRCGRLMGQREVPEFQLPCISPKICKGKAKKVKRRVKIVRRI
eukprot:TRINITY_DN43862_c0_g1_i1.p1 TRINITY_DN43862_c0_g1~~TRINITY_DN43862_c0_g1_i1.p1  ORF type:complete len:1068 (+),score=219.34 TRINITY_DN43862_c0_g1_i1:293-3205(+)